MPWHVSSDNTRNSETVTIASTHFRRGTHQVFHCGNTHRRLGLVFAVTFLSRCHTCRDVATCARRHARLQSSLPFGQSQPLCRQPRLALSQHLPSNPHSNLMRFASKTRLCLPHVIEAIVFSRAEHDLSWVLPSTPRRVQLAATPHNLLLWLKPPPPLRLTQGRRNVNIMLVSSPSDAPTLGLRLCSLRHPQHLPPLLLERTSKSLFILPFNTEEP